MVNTGVGTFFSAQGLPVLTDDFALLRLSCGANRQQVAYRYLMVAALRVDVTVRTP